MPAWNAADDLARHLPVVMAELPPDAELLVVDDGSTDGTGAVVTRAGAQLLSQPNQGPAAARNRGAREARGEILVFLDADCRPARGWLAALLAPFDGPGVDAVKGAYLTEQRSRVARLAQIEFEERYRLLLRHERTDFVDSFSMAIRRDVFLASGGFDPSFRMADNEDVDLSYRLAARGYGIVFAPQARVVHRHPDTLGRYFRLKLSRGYHRTVVYERYPGKAWRDSYTPLSLKLQVASLALVAAALPGAALWPVSPVLAQAALGGVAAGALGFMAASTPFMLRVLRSDPGACVAVLPFVIIRALAIGAGVLRRLLRLQAPRPK